MSKEFSNKQGFEVLNAYDTSKSRISNFINGNSDLMIKSLLSTIDTLKLKNKSLKHTIKDLQILVKTQQWNNTNLKKYIEELGFQRPKVLTGTHHYSKIIGIPDSVNQKENVKTIENLKEENKKIRKILNYYRAHSDGLQSSNLSLK